MTEHLVVVTRYPVPGRAKTRFISLLGPDGAADLSRRLSEYTVAMARTWRAGHADRTFSVHITGADPSACRRWLGDDFPCEPQGEGDLGARMDRALTGALIAGATRAVLIGCDCPRNDVRNLERAFVRLADDDLVLGPAVDGGYYLVGITRPQPSLFQGLAWGTPTVLAGTLTRAECQGLHTATLATLPDVDRPADLPAAEAVLAPAMRG